MRKYWIRILSWGSLIFGLHLLIPIMLLYTTCSPHQDIIECPPITAPKQIMVTATMYEPVPTQTDSTPNITADGTRINIRYAGKYRYKQAQKHIVTIGENMKKNPDTAALGELISDLKVNTERTIINRAYEKYRVEGGDLTIEESIKKTILDMLASKEITPDQEAAWYLID